MAWHANNLTIQTGIRAFLDGSALVNPNDLNSHKPTKHVFFHGFTGDLVQPGGDGHVHEFWSDRSDGKWNHQNLTDKTHAPLIAVQTLGAPSSYVLKGDGTKHVIYQEDNGRIHELRWDGDWHHTDLTSAAGNAPLAINAPGQIHQPFGYEYSFFDPGARRNIISQRVVYETQDNKIHQLRRKHGSGWDHAAVTDVPVPILQPTAYVFTVQGQTAPGQASQRVLYVDDQHHAWEFVWNEVGPNSQSWQANDLTVLSGAPLAESRPVGLMNDLEFTLHVFYRSKDQHLYELWWNNSGWQLNDLTALTASPIAAAAGPPLAYVHLTQGTLRVNYMAVDKHIHALWRDVGQQWNPANHEDLMPIGAPLPIRNPVGFVFRDLTQHLFYTAIPAPFTDPGGEVIELTDE
jgi:hypothetical protein